MPSVRCLTGWRHWTRYCAKSAVVSAPPPAPVAARCAEPSDRDASHRRPVAPSLPDRSAPAWSRSSALPVGKRAARLWVLSQRCTPAWMRQERAHLNPRSERSRWLDELRPRDRAAPLELEAGASSPAAVPGVATASQPSSEARLGAPSASRYMVVPLEAPVAEIERHPFAGCGVVHNSQPSPPRPALYGSATPSTNAAVIAASAAVPPRSSMSAACVAKRSQSLRRPPCRSPAGATRRRWWGLWAVGSRRGVAAGRDASGALHR